MTYRRSVSSTPTSLTRRLSDLPVATLAGQYFVHQRVSVAHAHPGDEVSAAAAQVGQVLGRYYKTRKQVDDRVATIVGARIADLITVTTGVAADGTPTIAWQRNPNAITAASRLDGLYAIATNLPDPPDRELPRSTCSTSTKTNGSSNTPPRPQTNPAHAAGLPAQRRPHPCAHRRRRHRPAHLRPHRAELRAALGPDTALPGLLPEHRDAVPTARAVLAAFTDLHATYTSGGLVLDRLTGVQRLILAHLDIPLPWSETTAPQQHSRIQTITPNYAENGPRLRTPASSLAIFNWTRHPPGDHPVGGGCEPVRRTRC